MLGIAEFNFWSYSGEFCRLQKYKSITINNTYNTTIKNKKLEKFLKIPFKYYDVIYFKCKLLGISFLQTVGKLIIYHLKIKMKIT